MKSYWDLLAHQFQHQQPPLRPCADDIHFLLQTVRFWHRRQSPPQIKILLLGVTPEIANAEWPPSTSLLAIEKSQAMIDVVWPGNIPGQREVILGNWFDIDLKNQPFDFVVGDGFLTGANYPDQYHQFAERISQWLAPSGLLSARLFVRSENKETFEAITADLEANRIPRFDILKWRLAMAIQESARQGVVVDKIYRAWQRIEQRWPSLPRQAGWPRLTVDTIKLYEGHTNRYSFPTIAEVNEAFSDFLEPVSITIPNYTFGQCCPTLVYRRVNTRD
jgi:hypothetical protein